MLNNPVEILGPDPTSAPVAQQRLELEPPWGSLRVGNPSLKPIPRVERENRKSSDSRKKTLGMYSGSLGGDVSDTWSHQPTSRP